MTTPRSSRTLDCGHFPEDSSSGRQVILDTATDSDIGSNGVDHRSYRIIREQRGPGRFRLDITLNPSGEGAFLPGVQGRAGPRSHHTVPAVGGSGGQGEPKRRGYLQVNVTVQDINDQPRFWQFLQAGVPEDAAVGSSVLQVAAADADRGTNADIRYRLQDGDPFQMDPETGLITVGALGLRGPAPVLAYGAGYGRRRAASSRGVPRR